MAKAEGYARPARFAVKLFLPANLSKLANQKDFSNFVEQDPRGQFSNMQPSAMNPDHATMQDLATQMGSQINIHCDSVSMPGKDLVTQKKQFGNEPEVDMVTGHQYSGMINASFYADKYLRERQVIELWMKMAHNNLTNEAKYYDDYVGYVEIYSLDKKYGPNYGVRLHEAYPKTIGPLDLNSNPNGELLKIPVNITYRYWTTLNTIEEFRQSGHELALEADEDGF